MGGWVPRARTGQRRAGEGSGQAGGGRRLRQREGAVADGRARGEGGGGGECCNAPRACVQLWEAAAAGKQGRLP